MIGVGEFFRGLFDLPAHVVLSCAFGVGALYFVVMLVLDRRRRSR